ncbi:MAG: type IA DNA topoisomerase [Lachnospiraceae bacterium]|nr:type IA DNA topoisomerase [Lachnospiraceae bacterium]
MKKLFIAEKPSVAREFAKVFSEKMSNHDGYIESETLIFTWCVGHLVTMSYPEVYDMKYKKWRYDTLPFIPETFKYEVIQSAKKQYDIVSSLLNREDVDTIYVCTDSGREGEYIYRLVRQEANVHDKVEKRVWIDSQTKDEIERGIREAKLESEYDKISDAAYLRAKEDYLMGINFSRLLTLRFGNVMASFLNKQYCPIAVGRVMTCVLGMVVRREREIRDFVKTPFYRCIGTVSTTGENAATLEGEWKAKEGSRYYNSPLLYKENGFKERASAEKLIREICEDEEIEIKEEEGATVSIEGVVDSVSKKTEKKNPPLLYNLAEIQNDCSKFFKMSPDETLAVIQELYEKKLVTYPRTDARVLSSAVAKEINKNLSGLLQIPGMKPFAQYILDKELYKGIEKTKYTDDKKITDHYALIPTGQGISALKGLSKRGLNVYEIIVRRFLAIFFPPALYTKVAATVVKDTESFFFNGKFLKEPGYLAVMNYSFSKKKDEKKPEDGENGDENENEEDQASLYEAIKSLKKGSKVNFTNLRIKEGETSPPKRYNSGSLILAMENAGQLIEDEELRETIKSQGIGTSATRAEILKKLVKREYLNLNKKTQILTPTLEGEMLFDVVNYSLSSLLNPELTASWEKGLIGVENGSVTSDEYMQKLEDFIKVRADRIKRIPVNNGFNQMFRKVAENYKK